METELHRKGLAATVERLAESGRERVAIMISFLSGEGGKNSQVVTPDDSEGGGLRARITGKLRLLFDRDEKAAAQEFVSRHSLNLDGNEVFHHKNLNGRSYNVRIASGTYLTKRAQ